MLLVGQKKCCIIFMIQHLYGGLTDFVKKVSVFVLFQKVLNGFVRHHLFLESVCTGLG